MDQKQKWLARAERYETLATAAEQKATAIYRSQPAHARDPAFLTQPTRRGQGVANDRDKLRNRERTAWEMELKAKAYREKAIELRRLATRNAGDAEREREARRAAVSDAVGVGDYVSCLYGVRRVLKINTNTFLIEGAITSVTIDKSLCRKVAGATPAAEGR